MNPADDQEVMAVLIQKLQDLEFSDDLGRLLRPKALAAVLRKNSFNVDRAADELEPVTAPDPCPTSIPGQWRIYYTLTRDDCYPDVDQPEFEESMEALRELPLKDKRGRHFCRRHPAAFYDPLLAADWLIIEADRIHGRDPGSNGEAKRAAWDKLTSRFTHVYASSHARMPQPWHEAGPDYQRYWG
jgi:hypothetical protein